MNEMKDEFSVCQFFEDGSYEYTHRFINSEEAVKTAIHYSTSVGAKLGTTVRVIITDGDDCINWEWKKGIGITYPPEVAGKLKH
jgi:hypothetical protein